MNGWEVFSVSTRSARWFQGFTVSSCLRHLVHALIVARVAAAENWGQIGTRPVAKQIAQEQAVLLGICSIDATQCHDKHMGIFRVPGQSDTFPYAQYLAVDFQLPLDNPTTIMADRGNRPRLL